MLKINIELWPFGYASEKEKLGSITIINMGNHPKSPAYGNYTLEVKDHNRNPWIGSITDFPRELGAVELLTQALELYRRRHECTSGKKECQISSEKKTKKQKKNIE